MKKSFIYISVCLGVVLYNGCNQGKTTTNQSDNTAFATTNSSNDINLAGAEGLQRIAVFSNCTNYDNKLSTVASEVRFIPLDYEPPIDDLIRMADIELNDDYIWLIGLDYIYQYDRQGNFIRNVGNRGMGPADYLQLRPPLQIDNTEKTIYTLDGPRKRVLVYNFDGTFNRAFPINFPTKITLLDFETIVFPSEHWSLPNALFLTFTDRDGQNGKNYYSHLHPVMQRSEAKTIPEANFFWEHAGRFYYLEYGADTIFQISRDTFVPVWVLTGELKLDKKELFLLGNTGKKLVNASNLFRPNAGIFESNRFLIFKLSDDQDRFYMVYDKVSGQFHRTYDKNTPVIETELPRGGVRVRIDNDYFIDDLISGLHFTPQYQSMGKAIGLISAITVAENRDEILRHIASHPSEESERLKPIVEKMDEFDNPLVMIVTFK